MKIFIALAAASFSVPVLVTAQTERDLEKHVHGTATLNVAVIDSVVLLELETPWNNLIGFEHSPETEEQKAMVDEALSQLKQPTELFAFDGGDCSLEDMTLESTFRDDEHEEHGDEHADEEHDDEHADEKHGDEHADEKHGDEHADEEHDDEHADEKHGDEHADEDHGDEHADEDGETHTEVLVTYSFQCKDIAKLNSIDLTLFSIWSGFEDLDVQLVGEGGQALEELNPENTVLDIAQVQ